MKSTLLILVSLFVLTSTLNAQEFEETSIITYTNAMNRRIAKKPKKAEIILKLPNITLYRIFKASKMNIDHSTGTGRVKGFVDVSDTYFLCIRPGEEVASFISWTFNTQINKNSIFRKNARQYFKDHPELVEKIKNREYKYEDIIEVVQIYDAWKSKTD